MEQQRISRRTLLKGLGTVTIGLPLLEEMVLSTACHAEPAVPVRAFNVFFGLGIPFPLQAEGFDGVLEPLRPLARKLLLLRNVDHVRCDEDGINAHWDGSAAAFTAERPNGTARAGGPSLDQLVKTTHYPEGLPPEMVSTLVAGTFFRRNDRLVRYVHSFNRDGTAAAVMQEEPRELFQRVFGTASSLDESDPRSRRMRRSVLDTVLEQFRFYTGERSPLGDASKARLADHMDRIREYEKRAFDMAERSTRRRSAPDRPPPSRLIHGSTADPGGQGIDVAFDELMAEWRLLADIYALAIASDRARFGSITFLAAGERIRLKGKYEYDGRTIFQFDDGAQRNATGDKACSHEWWHDFDESKKNEQLRAHAHMKIGGVAYFLQKLDGPECMEPNGRTILENTLITISTESGDGRHDNVKRELSGISTPSPRRPADSRQVRRWTFAPRASTSTTRCSMPWAPPSGSARATARCAPWTRSVPDSESPPGSQPTCEGDFGWTHSHDMFLEASPS